METIANSDPVYKTAFLTGGIIGLHQGCKYADRMPCSVTPRIIMFGSTQLTHHFTNKKLTALVGLCACSAFYGGVVGKILGKGLFDHLHPK